MLLTSGVNFASQMTGLAASIGYDVKRMTFLSGEVSDIPSSLRVD
jgi:hypothetical protein